MAGVVRYLPPAEDCYSDRRQGPVEARGRCHRPVPCDGENVNGPAFDDRRERSRAARDDSRGEHIRSLDVVGNNGHLQIGAIDRRGRPDVISALGTSRGGNRVTGAVQAEREQERGTVGRSTTPTRQAPPSGW